MKVKELIKLLQQENPETEVMYYDGNYKDYYYSIHDVNKSTIEETILIV